jgi:hypothetical protein
MRKYWVLVVTTLLGALGFSAAVASAGIVNVTLAGSGIGAVTSNNPAGIDCSNVPGSNQNACSYDFGFSFNPTTLTATPGEGSGFVGWSGTIGGTCVGGTNPCTTQSLLTGGTAIATFAPAPDPPVVSTGGVGDVRFPSSTVGGTVNPGSHAFAVTACYFEYGLTTDYGEKSACRPGAIGAGTSPVAVDAPVGVLDSGKTYHYRLVATNGGGTSIGRDRTFVSGVAPPDPCPNAAIRAQQGALAQRLRDCLAYELVSPPFTSGQGASVVAGSADGTRVSIDSVGGFNGTESLPDLGVTYASERTANGWLTSPMAPRATEFPWIGSSAIDWTRDQRRSLWFVNLKADQGTTRFTPIVRESDGSVEIAGPTQNVGGNESVVGASEDLSTIVQRTSTRPPLTDGTVDSRVTTGTPPVRSLYVSTRSADGQLSVRQVAFRGGATMSPNCQIELGGVSSVGSSLYGRNAISQDGSKIFFTTGAGSGCNAAAARRVWAKVGDADPIDLSETQCGSCGAAAATFFRGAARDGSRVYFSTTQKLLAEDQDTTAPNDIYEYDFNATGQKLRLVTGGPASAGANVAAASLFRVSDSGSYVYFVASGRPLTSAPNARGVSPVSGGTNLYVYHRAAGQTSSTIKFIGALSSINDQRSQLSSDGRYLLFETAADLTGERSPGDVHPDLYRYDAQSGELLRVWTDDPAHNGAARTGSAYVEGSIMLAVGVPSAASARVSTGGWNGNLSLSDDGSLVGFTTAAALSPDDRNRSEDAYLWDASTGDITMLTDGSTKPRNPFVGAGSRFSGMTPSGDSLFVTSSSPLVAAHDSGAGAAYVIRRGGGFLGPPPPPDPCAGDACQPSVPTPRGPDGSVGTSTFVGPGNVLMAPPSPAPSLSVSKVKTVRGAWTRATVRVSEAGKIRVSGRNLVRTSKAAHKSGTVRVLLKLTKRGKQQLRREGRVKTRIDVRFAPENGKTIRKRASVTFRSKATKRKSSSRSTRTSNVQSSAV